MCVCYKSRYVGVPGSPQRLSVTFDDSTEVLTVMISWQPPANSGKFDLGNYTVNIISSSGVNISAQVPAGTTTHQFTDERKQRAVFNVTVEATNKCEQTGNAVSTTQEYDPSEKCRNMHDGTCHFRGLDYVYLRAYLPML